MKRFISLSICFIGLHALSAQPNPEPKKLSDKFFPEDESVENVTPALQKKRGFTDYDELIAYINQQQQSYPELVTIDYIGKSQKGYDIPIVYISNKKFTNPKIKVWFQGALHGNEMATAETMLYTIYKLLHDNSLQYLLEKIDLAIVPMANIDGYLKSDRYSANGLDLNRDQTKLMAPESPVLKMAFNQYEPEVALDFHEYNPYRRDFAKLGAFGITSAYDAMFLYSSNLNVPEPLRQLTDTLFVENARIKFDQHGRRHADYVSTGKYFGEIHFNRGGSSARSSSTSFSLANTVAIVIEVRGIRLGTTSFKRRIRSGYLIGISFLETAYEHLDVLKETLKTSQTVAEKVAVVTEKRIYQDTFMAIDLDDYTLSDIPVTIRDAKGAKVILEREIPDAYILSRDLDFLVDKIKILGLEVETLSQDQNLHVEVYTVTEYEREKIKYEQMNIQHVKTSLAKKTILFPKGSFKVSTQQKRAGLLYEVLEPERPNSFVSFGLLETALNDELKIYRLTEN